MTTRFRRWLAIVVTCLIGTWSLSDGPLLAQTPPPSVPLTLPNHVDGTFAEDDTRFDVYRQTTGVEADFLTDAYEFTLSANQALLLHFTPTTGGAIMVYDTRHAEPNMVQVVDANVTKEFLYETPQDATVRVLLTSLYRNVGTYTLDAAIATPEQVQAYYDSLDIGAAMADGDSQQIDVPCDAPTRHPYYVDVPDGISTLVVETASNVDVDLFGRYGRPLTNLEDAVEYTSAESTGNESLTINLTSNPPLRPGRYFLTVGVRRGGACPFSFTVSTRLIATALPPEVVVDSLAAPQGSRIEEPMGGRLTPGALHEGRIGAGQTVQLWTFDVPEATTLVELRTLDATGRLDLVALPPSTPEPRDLGALVGMANRSFSPRDNERLLIQPGTGQTAIEPGHWYLYVLDIASRATSDYTITATIGGTATPLAPYDPATGQAPATTPLVQAVRATVQLVLSPEEYALASGTGSMLTPDGLILTNYHVVGSCELSEYLLGCSGDLYTNPDGSLADIYVGTSSESQSSAEQHYIAHVVRTLPEADLALIQIVSDLDGRPPVLPLPTMPLAVGLDAVSLAESISAIGYPGIATAGGRTSLTLTQGVVTGFSDDHGHRALIDIDANIGHGNSGGALVNAEGVLVGVPSNCLVNAEEGERQNYARPLSLLPEAWLQILRDHGAQVR